MAFTLWSLFEATLLCLNAICILHEERFLVKIGWSAKSPQVHGFGEQPSAKAQILNLIHSIRTVTRIRKKEKLKKKMENQHLKHKLYELIVSYLQSTQYEEIKEAICKFKVANDKKEQEIFEYPVKLNFLDLYQVADGALCGMLLKEPEFMQNTLNELFLMILKKSLEDPSRLQLDQIDCPMIIVPINLSLHSNSRGLCHIEGILLQKGIVQKYLCHPFVRSTWICRTCANYCVKRHSQIANNPQCSRCQTDMKEIVQDRKYKERIWLRIGNFNVPPANRLIGIQDIVDNRLNFELGAKYFVIASMEEQHFKAWSVTVVDHIPLPLSDTCDIVKLHAAMANNPWAFVHELSERVSINVCPRDMFITLKIGLLLSLCSTRTNDPIPIVAITDDSNVTHKLLANAGKYSERYLSCNHSSNLFGTAKENWFSGGAFHIARNGICYLNDWDVYNKNCKRNIANVVESKRIELKVNDVSDSVPLRCAFWSYVESTHKNAAAEAITLSQVFGLIWRVKITPEEENLLVDYILNDVMPIDRRFAAQIKGYIEYVNVKKVEISDQALNLLQHYFITIRKIRGQELPLTSFEPLQALTEAHARVNDRTVAGIEDALLAVQLCEHNLGCSPLISAPPIDYLLFKMWFQQNLGYKV